MQVRKKRLNVVYSGNIMRLNILNNKSNVLISDTAADWAMLWLFHLLIIIDHYDSSLLSHFHTFSCFLS